jgi:hypothetical protein
MLILMLHCIKLVDMESAYLKYKELENLLLERVTATCFVLKMSYFSSLQKRATQKLQRADRVPSSAP